MNVEKGLLHFVCFFKKHFIFLWPKVKSLAPGNNQELNLSLNQATSKTNLQMKNNLENNIFLLLVINEIMTRNYLFLFTVQVGGKILSH